jgi:hypothetical protein
MQWGGEEAEYAQLFHHMGPPRAAAAAPSTIPTTVVPAPGGSRVRELPAPRARSIRPHCPGRRAPRHAAAHAVGVVIYACYLAPI